MKRIWQVILAGLIFVAVSSLLSWDFSQATRTEIMLTLIWIWILFPEEEPEKEE